MKTYSSIIHTITTIVCSLLVITGAVIQFLHIEIGISGTTVALFALIFQGLYQTWYISKLQKQLKNKE